MRRCAFLSLLLLAVGSHIVAAPPSASPAGSFTGHYELINTKTRTFALDITQKGKDATVSFSAANTDGSGAAPDGDGKGTFNAKGELKFSFTDSFENSGTAILRSTGKTFQLAITMDKVTEQRAVVHYGTLTLRRTSAKPSSPDR